MLLRRFSVQGYKNFRQPVVLDDLGPINVIHGPNNAGKSALCPADAIVVTDDTGVEYHGCQTIKSAALGSVLRELAT